MSNALVIAQILSVILSDGQALAQLLQNVHARGTDATDAEVNAAKTLLQQHMTQTQTAIDAMPG